MDRFNLRGKKSTRRDSVDLHGEILTEILLRLPFDSILYCKFVSKEWKNLINHPTFSIKYKGFTNSMSLFKNFDGIYCVRIRHDKNKQLTKAGNPPFTVHKLPIITGDIHSCFIYTQISNGIACVKVSIGVYKFYNLVTGSTPFDALNDSPVPSPKFPCCWKYFGFGYDAYAHDYKIVQFCHYRRKPTGDGEIIVAPSIAAVADNTHFWVYSFNNQEWKSFDGCPYSEYTREIDSSKYSGATALNGVLHWLAPNKGVIITYDLHTCVFGEIVLPGVGVNDVWRMVGASREIVLPGIGLAYCGSFGLQELNGKLCYTYKRKWTSRYHPFYDLWRMVGDSWEMVESIDCGLTSENIAWESYSIRLKPLMLHEFEDGRRVVLFVGHAGFKLYWFDFVSNKCEIIPEKVWQKQKIKKRLGRRVKRKTSLVGKN